MLVVEDQVVIRMVTSELLREAGLEVFEASTGDEAAALLRGGLRVEAVFSDVQMPGTMDGIALALWIRERDAAIKLVLTSGQCVDPAGKGIADVFLPKPYSDSEVAETIKSLVGIAARASLIDAA